MFEFPQISNSVLLIVDLQQKLVNVMSDEENLLNRTAVMLRGASALGMDVIVTEQYPQGLGETVEAVRSLLPNGSAVIEKTTFSAFGAPEFGTALTAKRRKNIFICGVETHVCVLQSLIDALNRNYQVILLEDAVSSRKESDRRLGVEAARQLGAYVLSVEAALLMLTHDAKHPQFKTVSKLIR